MQEMNVAQQEAVKTVHGRVLVLAGAGSGKTKVIVHRIAHLIRDHETPPEQIVGLTFTNKAAKEMRQRLEGLIGKPVSKRVTLATFHSFCMHILRKHIAELGYTRDFSLYDEKDIERLVQQLAKEMLGVKELPSLAQTRANLMDASQKGESDPKKETWHDQFSQDLYTRLQTALKSHNAVHFDNLINLTLRLFEEKPHILDAYQEKHRYFMIDEYQDTNPAQFRLAELLSQKYRNLCVVGDDDQSIYGWRGAQIANILKFQADKVIKLEQNYRSSPTIIDAANAVIRNNPERHDKKLWSASSQTEPIEVFNAPTDVEEAQAVIQRILHYHAEGVRWKEMAILYRSNALSRHFEMALVNASWQCNGKWVRGIPYEIFGGLEFSERSEIKDVFAYLRVIANPKDQEALLRIINVPRRGISDTFLDELTTQNRAANIGLWDLLQEIKAGHKTFANHPKGMTGIRNFVDLIESAQKRFEDTGYGEALTSLLETISYKNVIEEEVKSDKMRDFKWENVQECIHALIEYEEKSDPETRSLQDFIGQSTLSSSSFKDHGKTSSEDKVQMMTLHSAKGLEFPICFMVGLEDHILPHAKSREITGVEEERRLMYVGITRAQKKLILSMARARMRTGKAEPSNPSRFLFEIPKHLLKVTNHLL